MPNGINLEIVTALVSFLFTILVLSYLVGDTPLFRIAIYAFVGAAAGYVAAVSWHQVLWPKLVEPLVFGSGSERLLLLVPLLLGFLLLTKASPRLAWLGSPAVGFMVGVGAAVAVGGAVLGTILPQVEASVTLFDLTKVTSPLERFSEAGVILIGTLTTLVYFHFGAKAGPQGPRRSRLVGIMAWIGQIFIAVTFGVLFASIYAAALTALIERLHFLWTFIASFF